MSDCSVCNGTHDTAKHSAAIEHHREKLKEYNCQCGGQCPLCKAVAATRLTEKHPKRKDVRHG